MSSTQSSFRNRNPREHERFYSERAAERCPNDVLAYSAKGVHARADESRSKEQVCKDEWNTNSFPVDETKSVIGGRLK
jgi:hypothetical protein